ncbi:outer membrane protein OmpA-like peptidoglycan-associated protein/opacity protein-like surface antigen [Flavobacterium sp. CG_23.5]|uniref:OmpA family protein n=1 Tax=unclassified Flavobacterium TaxID=196869 RepID=UPI0018C9CB8F|nr:MULTISPECIES: OmpA family protein [unclassified Flavobacterium]MBG6111590.1 outer membrane protein OmpA-like peptidoglycan-associated protein/opacity protein-like surface antigen [Flavobacterium sp. CG_9.10]MBP2282317.1 outer membrane protein OmpA-like peptidoglycan-associated protein/opacity protein-like surface antigen [Flavobacterium sp. CG_23.5]
MKAKNNSNVGLCLAYSPNKLTIKSVAIIALSWLSFQTAVQAQEAQAIKYTKPSWFFGVAGGANFNFYRGSTQQMNADFKSPVAFHDGFGTGLYIAPLLEFHRPESRWGFMLQAGYDSRKGKFDQVVTPCDCPADLSTKLSYVTVEPSLRFAPFKNNFYLYGGPRLAFNMDKSFTYQLGVNPAIPTQAASPAVKGDFDNIDKTLISMQIGAGYDIPLSSDNNKTQFVLSPFVSFQPYFGQNPRSTETWNITTVRAGVALKFGQGTNIQESTDLVKDREVQFSVDSPKNVAGEQRMSEILPLRNYVFFNIGSTEIPSRYVLLNKNQVKDFKEDQLEVFAPKNLSDRSKRQMVVYYNVLNILGDRMQKNPSATITLVGSSEKGTEDGLAMSESIKTYLVNVFEINPSRISTKGQSKPAVPSEQPGATLELELLREGDRRVTIESNSSNLLMEFQSGPDAQLKPVVIMPLQEAPVESYVTINNKGAKDALSTYSIQMTDEQGKVQSFGPYTEDVVTIPGKSILGNRAEGDFTMKMVGQTKSGKVIEKETPVHVVLWKPATIEQGIRYSILYEFNKAKAITIYEKYLTDVVTPKIPVGGMVIIHGHTDIIGGEAYNLNLSAARANDVKTIIESALSKAGRNDVKFEVNGFGEDENKSPFENKTPEERFYNRTVVIDIIPVK